MTALRSWIALGMLAAGALPALAVADPWSVPGPPPGAASLGYEPGVCVVRLRSAAAAGARLAFPAGATRAARLGVPALDRVAAELGGATFEVEFRNEATPPPGSRTVDFTGFYVVHLPPGVAPAAAAARFAALAEVESASLVAMVPMYAVPNDSLWSAAYHLYQPSRLDIHALEAWDLTTGDSSIVVAVLDTGVIPYHPDLGGTIAGSAGNLWVNPAEEHGLPGVDDDGNGFVDDARGWDFVSLPDSVGVKSGEDWRDADPDPNDFAGHGTAVAGLVGALSDNRIGITGTAWHLRIMPVRVAWSTDNYPLGQSSERFIAQGIRYATRMGASVINLSLSTEYEPDLDAAVQGAVDAGVVIVAAAGNNGITSWITSREDVIAVGATDRFDQLAAFSNRGPEVDLCAPGQDLATTVITRPGLDSLGLRQPHYIVGASGTSFAAPIVAAAAGLVQSWRHANGLAQLSSIEMLLRLRDSAHDLGATNAGAGWGGGRLDLFHALTDPERSRVRALGAQPVGPPLVLPTASGHARVVVATEDRSLVFLDGGSGETLRVVTLRDAAYGFMAAADLGGGRGNGIFIGTTGGQVVGLDAIGEPLPGWPASFRTNAAENLVGGPALGDLDADGSPEIVLGTNFGALWAWHADGSLVAGFPITGLGVSQPPALTPVDAQPGAEILLISGNLVHALRYDGQEVAGWPYPNGGGFTAPVVIATGADHAPTVFVTKLSQMVGLGPDAVARVTFTMSGVGRFEPAAGDLNGDGVDDLAYLLPGQNQLVLLDPVTGSGFGYPWPYENLPVPLEAPLIARVGTAAVPDVVVTTRDGLLAVAPDGTPVPRFPSPLRVDGSPAIADLAGRGTAEVLAGSAREGISEPAPRLFAMETNAPWSEAAASWPTLRGNNARTGSRLYAPPSAAVDDAPPPAVSDLGADSVGSVSAILRWTAPALPHGTGGAAAYEVRTARLPLTEANFPFGVAEPGVPPPAAAGQPERLRLTTLTPQGVNYVALRARDRFGGWSPISNVLTLTTGPEVPAPVADLLLSAATDTTADLAWTATAAEGGVVRPARYEVRAGSAPLDDAEFDAAPLVWSGPARAGTGGTERAHVGGLTAARDYWFAVRAEDAAGHRSPVSRALRVRTDVGGPLRGTGGVALAFGAQPARGSVAIYWRGGGVAPQSLKLFDLSGRIVKAVELGAAANGVLQWNGRDDGGRRVPAGIYFARLISGSFHAQARVVLLP